MVGALLQVTALFAELRQALRPRPWLIDHALSRITPIQAIVPVGRSRPLRFDVPCVLATHLRELVPAHPLVRRELGTGITRAFRTPATRQTCCRNHDDQGEPKRFVSSHIFYLARPVSLYKTLAYHDIFGRKRD